MGAAERRQREREALRSQILEVARDLFVAKGYDGVTLREIADRIEYTPPTVYAHFRDKETLVRVLCDEDFRALRGAFESLVSIEDPLERLRALGLAYLKFALAHPHHYRFMFLTPHPGKPEDSTIDRNDPDQDAYAFLRESVVRAIEAGRFRAEFADAELVAQLLWSALHGLIALHLTYGDDRWIDWRPIVRTAETQIDVILRGLSAAGG